MPWNWKSGEKCRGEKCLLGKNVAPVQILKKNGEKCRLGKNVAGKNVMGKNVIWGKMSCTQSFSYILCQLRTHSSHGLVFWQSDAFVPLFLFSTNCILRRLEIWKTDKILERFMHIWCKNISFIAFWKKILKLDSIIPKFE